MRTAQTRRAKDKQYYKKMPLNVVLRIKKTTDSIQTKSNLIKGLNTELILRTKSLLRVHTPKHNTASTRTKKRLILKLDMTLTQVFKRQAHVHTVEKTKKVYVLIGETGMCWLSPNQTR